MRATIPLRARALVACLLPVLAAPAGAQCEGWTEGFHLAGPEEPVHALQVHDDGSGPALFVGGEFTMAGDVLAAAIARWDGQAWSALGVGLAGGDPTRVTCLAVFDDGLGGGPALYAGGDFTTAGGVAASGIARWDGAAWHALGSGVQGTVGALRVHDDGSGPALVVGGQFASAGGIAAANIARWDGLAWSALGSGVDDTVFALGTFDLGAGPLLVAGGAFFHAGGQAAACIASWDGSAWKQVGDGLGQTSSSSGAVRSLALFDEGTGPRLFAGGDLTVASIYQAAIARLDGATWSHVGAGLSIVTSPWGPWASVRDLRVHDDGSGAGPRLIATGLFDASGPTTGLGHVAAWDGSSWSALDHGLGPDYATTGSWAWGYALASFDDGSGAGERLFLGGDFQQASGAAATHLTRWDGASWSGSGFPAHGVWGGVADLAIYDAGLGPELVAAGSILTAGDRLVSGIARWDGASWHALGSGLDLDSGSPQALAVFDPPGPSAPGLYAAGGFRKAGGVSAERIARWDGSGWSALGSGLDHQAHDLAVVDLGTGPALYVCGYFKQAGGLPAEYLARWNGTQWSAVGGGPGFVPFALLGCTAGPDGGPSLYVGGGYGPTWSFLRRWDGSSWSSLGGGVNGVVWCLALLDGDLYAGGFFTLADGQAAAHIARWDGSVWSAVGGGTNDLVTALEVWDDGSGAGPALYVAGRFQRAGPLAVRGLARWDGSAWSAPGEVDPLIQGDIASVRVLRVHDDGRGPALHAGGSFRRVDDLPSVGIARLANACGTQPVSYCTAKVSSPGCTPAIGWSGTPSATAPAPFLVSATQIVNNKLGLLFYGLSGAAAKPFQGGTLCVASPIWRTTVQWSAGNPPPDDCSGGFAIDFNAWIQAGKPGLVPGAEVRAQYWYRDPASPSTTGLSDAIAFGIGP